MDIGKLVTQPVFFERNRVYRLYVGGKSFRELFGDGYDDGTDNRFPEEWVASSVKALKAKSFGKRGGVSVVKGTDIFFDDLLRDSPEQLLGGRKYDCLGQRHTPAFPGAPHQGIFAQTFRQRIRQDGGVARCVGAPRGKAVLRF